MTDTRNFANALENEGSAPVYLLDKKLDERTSQSAVETTDYVLLEDTDGAFHKIAKNSFNEAVRGALGSMLNNLDKGKHIKSVVGLGSASPVNDLGTVTLANLASLLGGEFDHSLSSFRDISNIPFGVLGAYTFETDSSGLPSFIGSQWGYVIVLWNIKFIFRNDCEKIGVTTISASNWVQIK